MSVYNKIFYDRQVKGSLDSANVIVPIIINLINPKSVIDVGCGLGTWLHVFNSLGVNDILGLDGDWIDQSRLLIPKNNFVKTDLENPIKIEKKFDLAVSLEVAEHITKENSEKFIKYLTDKAPVILFSAAIPNQGGTNHINEQWLEYWEKIFKKNNYKLIDCIRDKIWRNEDVEMWYVQNTVIFVEKNYLKKNENLKNELKTHDIPPYSIVHPKLYSDKIKELIAAQSQAELLSNELVFSQSQAELLSNELVVAQSQAELLNNVSQRNAELLNNELFVLRNELIVAQNQTKSVNQQLNSFKKELRKIANTKPYRLAYFIHRFKFEFLIGNNQNKRSFINWLFKKIVRRPNDRDYTLNPLVGLVKRKYKEVLKKSERLDLENYNFFKFKNAKDRLYGFPLSYITCPYENDLVSIILPVYNGEKMVEESIESILSQTYENFELIIINDGSIDRTEDILKFYKSKDHRIKIYHQENKGLPVALSRGFRNASGEFYTWTSDDNIMDQDFIEKLVDDIKENKDIGMIYANIRLIDVNGNPILNHKWYPDHQGSDNVNLPKSTMNLNIHPNNTIGPAFIYRASAAHIIEDYSKYQFGLEDYDYWMRLNSLLTMKHSSFSHPIYSYRFHDNSLTAKAKELRLIPRRDQLMIWDDFRRYFYLSPMIWVVKSDEYVLKKWVKNEILN